MAQFNVIIFMFFWIYINKFFFKNYLNLPTLITIIWCLSLFFSLFGFYNIYVPSIEVIWYTFIFVSSFNIFSIYFNFRYKNKTNTIIKTNKIISNKFLSFLLIICIIALLIICHKGLLLFISTHDFDIVRNSYINYLSIGIHMQVFLTITFIPLGEAAFIYSIENFVVDKKIKSSLILSILFIILVSLLTGARSMIFFFILVTLVAIMKKGFKSFFIKNKKIIKICLILIIILFIITSQRNFGNNGILNSVYVYFCGCFNLFGVYIKKNMVFGKKLLYGKVLLGGVFFPITQLLRYLFHIDILPGVYILEAEATSLYIPISSKIVINATPTSMFACIRDFGIYGLILYPLFISYIYNKLKLKKENNIMYESIYTYFVACCLLLNTTYYFGKFQIVSVFLYLFIIYKINTNKKINC